MAKAPQRRRLTGGAYKKGQQIRMTTHDDNPLGVPSPGVVHTTNDLAEQWRIVRELKQEAAKLLRDAQKTARRYERRETLLRLAGDVDTTVEKLEIALGRLRVLSAAFSVFTVNSYEELYAMVQNARARDDEHHRG